MQFNKLVVGNYHLPGGIAPDFYRLCHFAVQIYHVHARKY